VPAQSRFAPAITLLMAAARVMPGVCGVFESSWSLWTILTPPSRHGLSDAADMFDLHIYQGAKK
jgi:hypothetical protein